MTLVGDPNAAASLQLAKMLPPRVTSQDPASSVQGPSPRTFRSNGQSTEKLNETFTQFVGETFFAQMIKAMRSTVGKPAYFHGGRGEDVFQGRLDQQLAEHLTEASAAKIAEPLFERQFPHLAEHAQQSPMSQLSQLPRR
jgi:hypothetical protein